MYQVRLKQFSGPLDKLLELIEERNLDIAEISLAEVTADFLNFVKKLNEEADPKTLADFLVVAARLVLIKSKILLPGLELTKEEETEIKDLEGRLKLYKEFKRAGQYVNELWLNNRESFSRPFLMNLGEQSFFYPSPNLKMKDMVNSIKNLVSSLRALLPETIQVAKRVIITIESKIQELLKRFKETAEHSFKKISTGKSKKEIIVIFLAILHLLKDKIIKAEQKGQFSDIILKKSDGD